MLVFLQTERRRRLCCLRHVRVAKIFPPRERSEELCCSERMVTSWHLSSVLWAVFHSAWSYSTHFSVAFPPFLTATTVNNVATNSKPGHSRSSKWVKQSVRYRNACGKWPFLMALASARQEGSVGMVRNWSVLWEGASRTCHVGVGILGN